MPMFATHTKQRRGRLHEQRGAALAELAIVMPLLLLLLLGMLDFGKMFNEWIRQTHLASEGARLAAVNYCPSPSTDGSGNLVCDWSSIGCGNSNPNICLAQYIDDQTSGELKTGRAASSTSPAQNAAQVCISYPNTSATQVGDPVKVTVVEKFHFLNYLTANVSLGSTPISGSATMRLESKPYTGVPLGSSSCYPNAPAGT
jgi:Flp pilus assembly protein TadG